MKVTKRLERMAGYRSAGIEEQRGEYAPVRAIEKKSEEQQGLYAILLSTKQFSEMEK